MSAKKRRQQKRRPSTKRTGPRAPQPTQPPDRASNPMIPWLHGLAAIGDERWDEAIASLQHFLELDNRPAENRPTAYQNLSACYLALERYDEALAALNEAERWAPDDPDLLHSRGVVYACAARIPEAIAAFELFARRWPRLARQQDTREAIRLLRRIQRDEIAPGTYLIDHLQEQVSHNIDLGDYHLVERKARRMIVADPARPEGYFALGVAGVEQRRYAEALEAFQAAQARDPDYAVTLYNLGYTCLQAGEPAQAVPWLEQALRRDPKYVSALFQMGVACERLGQRDEAVTWWRRALKIDRSYYLAQERLHEAGLGPAPAEPPLSPVHHQLRAMTPIVKARMRRPTVHRQGGLTLTYDAQVGFVFEDAENPRNATIHAGGPFRVARIGDEDLLDLMGLVKMLLGMIHADNTRDIALLVYYADRPSFGYQARFARGQRVELDADGQFVVTEVPRLFKLRIDSDLASPYGDPMRGFLIYLNQHPEPGVLVNTLGLLDESAQPYRVP
ncbi:MAG: tetratricopeptide repeat protein [Chloroflexi bacterium]|nr:tetratricopeptide repeat protein [Chloroflexota bacterium]MBU1748179.1 tetratricopeptide repeat protein [Chloroflexota bacterium]MBU1878383.1 tetratricopeptide repeat protein [Chloroflexota bacterium]